MTPPRNPDAPRDRHAPMPGVSTPGASASSPRNLDAPRARHAPTPGVPTPGTTTASKRGPKTAAGRRRASLNALSHGALARTPVIPGVEDEAAWTQLLAGFRASLDPADAFEDCLVDLIASTAWRIKRLERYETEMLALAQLNAEQEAASRILFPHGGAVSLQGATAASVIAGRIDRLRRLVDLILRLQDRGPATTAGLSRADLDLLYDGLDLALSRRGPEADDLHRHLVEGIAGDPDRDTGDRDFAARVSALLRDAEELMGDAGSPAQPDRAAAAAPNFAALVARYPAELVLVCARPEILRLEHAAHDLDATIARIRSESLLLDAGQLAAIMRYEAHLRRQFVQYRHELQAHQPRRAGRPVPYAQVDVQLSAPV